MVPLVIHDEWPYPRTLLLLLHRTAVYPIGTPLRVFEARGPADVLSFLPWYTACPSPSVLRSTATSGQICTGPHASQDFGDPHTQTC